MMNLVGHSLSQCCSTFPCLQVGSDGQPEGLRDAYQEWGFVDEQEIRMENLVTDDGVAWRGESSCPG